MRWCWRPGAAIGFAAAVIRPVDSVAVSGIGDGSAGARRRGCRDVDGGARRDDSARANGIKSRPQSVIAYMLIWGQTPIFNIARLGWTPNLWKMLEMGV